MSEKSLIYLLGVVIIALILVLISEEIALIQYQKRLKQLQENKDQQDVRHYQ